MRNRYNSKDFDHADQEFYRLLTNELMEVLMDFNQRVKDATAKVVADEAHIADLTTQAKSLQDQLAASAANTVPVAEVKVLVDAILGPEVIVTPAPVVAPVA